MDDKKLKLGVPATEGQLSMMFARGGPREGAGRKGIGETRKVSVTLTKETWSAFEQRCGELGCSKSELFRGLIESYLKP
ncbi:ribbon-helix-helix domain-containing protein [Paenibacillus arenilitoris]|uniref:Ribbon-helix-helix protein, CopG family n=1 Tax=Paenibacillus arenilitoris TaxID=2772299 RepID=A0A927CJS6_9BACL|nr:ribbon-helix-helix domain-containing protein [Paenibacillus arenilitoris]MBD2869354.1 ribbon-helix-helix protein, CopG family [Paenibacillus arenilitoris]